jgi:hypothetical protein
VVLKQSRSLRRFVVLQLSMKLRWLVVLKLSVDPRLVVILLALAQMLLDLRTTVIQLSVSVYARMKRSQTGNMLPASVTTNQTEQSLTTTVTTISNGTISNDYIIYRPYLFTFFSIYTISERPLTTTLYTTNSFTSSLPKFIIFTPLLSLDDNTYFHRQARS